MCETLGTDWENIAKQQIALKLEAYKAIKRVRNLHKPNSLGLCTHCEFMSCNTKGWVKYPCDTIRKLNGRK